MIKAIFFDIDGTLLSHQSQSVPASTKKALKILKEKGIYTFIATGRHISEIKDLPLDDLEFEGYITLNGQYCYNKEGVQKAISTPLPELGDLKRGLTHPIYQVIPYDITIEQEQEILQQMPHCQYTRWHDLAIDIIPQNGGKQNGILEVLKNYHISIDETMAFGDGHNDIDMLKLVNIGIAMGNANDEVKEAADEVTDNIDHDGIYKALKKHHLIDE